MFNPAQSWSIQFVREWWPYLTPSSILRWRDALLRAQGGASPDEEIVTLTLTAPIRARIALRGAGSDACTMQEVMVSQVYRGLKDLVPHCETVIDLGANIGLASLYLAGIHPECRVFAVEPYGANAAILMRNLQPLIRSGRADVLQAAVWERNADLEFQEFANAGAFDSVVVREAKAATPAASRIPGMTMDTIIRLSGFSRVDILKVDIEGAEEKLFRGDTSWLDQVGAVAIEFHGDARVRSGFDDVARAHGFTVDDRDAHTVLAHRPGDGSHRRERTDAMREADSSRQRGSRE